MTPVGRVTVTRGPTIGAARPDDEPERWLAEQAAEARDSSAGVRYDATNAILAAKSLKARPDLWGGRDWTTLCREVIREERPGFLDWLLENEPKIKGLSHAEAVKLHAQQVAQEAKPARPQGRPPKADKGSDATFSGGRGADYLAARIARDAPEVHERMKRGEFPSVRAAAKEAGIVRDPTPLELLRKAWKKASAQERAAFLDEAGGNP